MTASLGSSYRRLFTASVVTNLGDGVALVAYPWLASAITRNPVLIALVTVVQRLPWLVFTLPAGVITDRVDRRRAMVAMDLTRAALTLGVALAVLGLGDDLPAPDALDAVTGTRTGLYSVLLVSTLLLGIAEVLRDNSAQTILPAIVPPEQLEKANGRMWSAELVANSFAGPPLGSLLLAGSFALPFFVDSASFAVAAALVALVTGHFRARPAGTGPAGVPVGTGVGAEGPLEEAPVEDAGWKSDLVAGVRWLWHHELLRPMAIILGVLNAIGALSQATLVLFTQELLSSSPVVFAVITMGAAIGGVVGGVAAPAISRRIGSGPSLALTLWGTALTSAVVGLATIWPIVLVMFGVEMTLAMLWNVITVSLRQAIIPDHLLGRVNSVYRFFAWGMMPVGTAIGGLVVIGVEPAFGREVALRAPWFVAAGAAVALALYARPRLTSAAMTRARAEATGT